MSVMWSSTFPRLQVEAVENGRVVHHYIAIVGDPDHPSPEISAHIQVVNLNPTWTVPTSIIKKEIIPRMQRDPVTSRAPRSDSRWARQGDQSEVGELEHRAGDQSHAAAGFGRGQFAWLDPHRHAQQARRLYARHAVQGGVRLRLPVPEPRLRPGAGRLRLRGVAVGRHARRTFGRLEKAALQAKIKEGAATTSTSPRPCR